MNKLAAISRADLLAAQLSSGGLDDFTAQLLGFQRKSKAPPVQKSQIDPNAGEATKDTPDTPPSPAPEPPIEFPEEKPRLKFLMPMRYETLKLEPISPDVGNPISDDELRVPWDKPGLRLRPLIRWPRLSPFLKQRMGTDLTGTCLDLRRLLRLATNGKPLLQLPRRTRRAWASQGVIIWDQSSEMFPFAEDVAWLCHQLKRERGHGGLRVIECKGCPRIRDLAAVIPGTPILALSAMGQFTNDEVARARWHAFGNWLQTQGHHFQAISPVPKDRWNPELAQTWSLVNWDRGHRLPRAQSSSHRSHKSYKSHSLSTMGLMRPIEPTGQKTPADDLLDLLSPSSLVEPALLREARMLMAARYRGQQPVNAGTEWDAWHHADGWHSISSFGFLPGEVYDERLARRRELADRELVCQISNAICIQHETCSSVIAAEAELRSCLTGASDEDQLAKVKSLLDRVIDRLKRLARHPQNREGRISGLPEWFPQMIQRLSPDIRQDPAIETTIAEGLALAHTWLKTDVELPRGVNVDRFDEATRLAAAAIEDAADPIDYIVGMHGSHLSFFPADSDQRIQTPLGRIRAGGSQRIQIASSPSSETTWIQLNGEYHPGIRLKSPPSELTIESSHSRLHFAGIERPDWAQRMWYDKFGIAAEFKINDVPFVLRWIPPGHFLMGSPDDEQGRYIDEGPQHVVTISRGFWMGETPVTQGQWAAVGNAADSGKRSKMKLKANPSRFTGSENLPVEQVSWETCVSFCNVLTGLVSREKNWFQLPTEAQWEYACRAGTQSAFNDGSACTEPEGNDPALAILGWFGDNSEKKTHPVKQKRPNHWGLYDMHGNVWEWCRDGMRDFAEVPEDDPVGPMEESAGRVVRGGSWLYPAQRCRAAYRDHDPPGSVWDYFGFRLFAGQEPVLGAERPVP